MKTVITQKVESISTAATHGKTLENQTGIVVFQAKGELVPQTSRQFDQHHPKGTALIFSFALGICGLILSPFVTSAVVSQKTASSAAISVPQSSLSALAQISRHIDKSVQADEDFVYPLVNFAPLTSPFGWRIHPISGQRRLHAGVDFEAPHGAPVVAAITGKVIMADWNGGHGKTVVIEREGRLQTLYAHLSKMVVQKGQIIQQGQVIGYVGTTGRSTGAHLHFETLLPGKDKDTWVAFDPSAKVQYALQNFQPPAQISQQNTNIRPN